VVLERFPKRKGILLAAKIYFYAMYILATTLMPQFVTDPDARLIWFVVLVFLAHAVYAVFSPGMTTWFYKFYPEDNARRTRYITLNQTFSSIMSSAILLLSGLLTDAVADSPYQNTLILAMRYLAFVLVLIDVGMQACAKEYPYAKVAEKPKLLDIFRLPFRYRKFMMCMVMMFAWNYIANLNGGMWNYHLLNHMHFSYTLINTMSVMYTIILVLTSGLWRKLLQRYSWIKTFGIACMIWWPTEFFFFFMVPGREWIYIPLSLVQQAVSVGLNLSYANILYMNLPEENTNTHIVFYSVGANIFAFLGLLTGTWLSSLTGDTTVHMFGMDMYSIQWTTVARGVTILAMALVCILKWRSFTKESDIEDIELQEQQRKQIRQVRKLRGQM